MPAPEPIDDATRHHAPGAPRAAGDTGRSGAADPTGPLPSKPATVGRYEVRAVLGEGTFGRVYRAFDPELRREVAIKVPNTFGFTPEVRSQFLREARAAATVQHTNVCPIYDVGTDGDVPFIVMRLVPGRTLADALADRPTPLPPRHAAALARKLALGVAAAHAEGVVHRDLKPQNVLWDEAGRQVFVTDFGLARVRGDTGQTAPGDVLGTPSYMAPEQARGDTRAVGPLSDVYSLGVVLYRMLADRLPYTGTVFEVMLRACEGNPPPPSAVRPGVDPALDRVCLKAMAVTPAARYPSARAFADALGDYLRGSSDEVLDLPADEPPPPPSRRTPSTSQPRPRPRIAPPPPPPPPPPPRRRFGRFVLAVSVLTLLGGAVAAGLHFGFPRPPEVPPRSDEVASNTPPAAEVPPTPAPIPVTPAPVTPEPVTPAPVTPAPMTPEPVAPAPVAPAPVTPAPVTPEVVGRSPLKPPPGPRPPTGPAADGLRDVMAAIRQYDTNHDRLPPAALLGDGGVPALSWRVAILPELGYEHIHKKFRLDEPWDSPHNVRLVSLMPREFQGTRPVRDWKTAFRVFVGGRAAFDPRLRLRVGNVPDGAANTFGVAEAGDPVEWTRPGADLPFDGKAAPRLVPPGGGDDLLVGLLDGTVRRLSLSRTPPDVLRRGIDTADGEAVRFE